jgi:hypothetical protein
MLSVASEGTGIFDIGEAHISRAHPAAFGRGVGRCRTNEAQLRTLKRVWDILVIHFNFSVASFCRLYSPMLTGFDFKGFRIRLDRRKGPDSALAENNSFRAEIASCQEDNERNPH